MTSAWARKLLIESVSVSHSSVCSPGHARAPLSYSVERHPELRGHFPSLSLLPAVYSMEALYQTTAALIFSASPAFHDDVATHPFLKGNLSPSHPHTPSLSLSLSPDFLSCLSTLSYPTLRNARFYSPITPDRACHVTITAATKRETLVPLENTQPSRVYTFHGVIHDEQDGAVVVDADFDMVLSGEYT